MRKAAISVCGWILGNPWSSLKISITLEMHDWFEDGFLFLHIFPPIYCTVAQFYMVLTTEIEGKCIPTLHWFLNHYSLVFSVLPKIDFHIQINSDSVICLAQLDEPLNE